MALNIRKAVAACPVHKATKGFSYAMIGVFLFGLIWTVVNSALMLAHV